MPASDVYYAGSGPNSVSSALPQQAYERHNDMDLDQQLSGPSSGGLSYASGHSAEPNHAALYTEAAAASIALLSSTSATNTAALPSQSNTTIRSHAESQVGSRFCLFVFAHLVLLSILLPLPYLVVY